MNVDQEIKVMVDIMRQYAQRIRWLREHKAKLEALPEARMCGLQLDFDRLPHKEIVKVVRELGGKWKKTPNGESNPGKVDYETKVGDVLVCCWAGDPPPSCRIVEVEEIIPERIIPASVRKVKKMICQPQFAAVIKMAAERATSNVESK